MSFAIVLAFVFAATPDLPSASPITNGAQWRDGRPISLPNLRRPKVEATLIFEPGESDGKYAHHAGLAVLGQRMAATWSCADRDEDSAGQHVLLSVRDESGRWNRPTVLFEPELQPDGRRRVLTAAGFHRYGETLVAYAGDYTLDRKSTRLLARTTTDLVNWSAVRDLHVPVCPNYAPQPIEGGRLLIAGNTAFPYTDDPTGLDGWKMVGIYPASLEPFQDNPATFWHAAKQANWPANVCEGSFFQTADGTLHMLLRATGGKPAESASRWCLWESISTDRGASWSSPRPTTFSNTDSKFHCGRLPDGRFYCVNNPIGGGRIPLVFSASRDGVHFDQHYLLGDKPYTKRFEGLYKGGHYGYPHTLLVDGVLYVIVTRQKESVEVLRLPLAELAESK